MITFLEDRRVLYVPSEMEVPGQCICSVLDIRRYLTLELQKAGSDTLVGHLRAMRAACRKFLNTVGADEDEVLRFGADVGHWASWVFQGAIGELRGVFGVHTAALAVTYGLDVEGDLVSIFPGAVLPDDDGDERPPGAGKAE